MTSKLFGDLCIYVYLEWLVIHQFFNSLHNDFVLATISIPFTPGVCKCRCCQCHFLVNVIFQPSFLTISMKLINTVFFKIIIRTCTTYRYLKFFILEYLNCCLHCRFINLWQHSEKINVHYTNIIIFKNTNSTVKPLYNSRPGDREKWLLYQGAVMGR